MAGLIVEATFEPSGNFAVARAKHIAVGSSTLARFIPIGVTEEQRAALQAAGATYKTQPYFIVEDENYVPEGLDDIQRQALIDAGLYPDGDTV